VHGEGGGEKDMLWVEKIGDKEGGVKRTIVQHERMLMTGVDQGDY